MISESLTSMAHGMMMGPPVGGYPVQRSTMTMARLATASIATSMPMCFARGHRPVYYPTRGQLSTAENCGTEWK